MTEDRRLGEPIDDEARVAYRAAVDRIVAAVHAGATPDEDDLAEVASGTELADLWSEGWLIWRGSMPVLDEYNRKLLAEQDGEFWRLVEVLPDERIAQIVAQAPDITDEELLAFARDWFARMQEDTDNADSCPGVWPLHLTGTDGREVYLNLLAAGFSFSGVDYSVQGPFESWEDLDDFRRNEGWLSADEITLDDVQAMRPGADETPGQVQPD